MLTLARRIALTGKAETVLQTVATGQQAPAGRATPHPRQHQARCVDQFSVIAVQSSVFGQLVRVASDFTSSTEGSVGPNLYFRK
jgi:hypothetical protein